MVAEVDLVWDRGVPSCSRSSSSRGRLRHSKLAPDQPGRIDANRVVQLRRSFVDQSCVSSSLPAKAAPSASDAQISHTLTLLLDVVDLGD